MLLLYCLPLLFMIDQGVVHVVVILSTITVCGLTGVVHVVVILSIITVLGLVDEWFMVLLCCLSSLLFMI